MVRSPLPSGFPPKTLETWRKHGYRPPGGHAGGDGTHAPDHMGVDQDYENLTKQISRTALADGWGGSMVATEISDILFGTPTPVRAEVNMGCLKEDQVNIIIHGHEPNLLESILASVNDPGLLAAGPRPPGPRGSTWWVCAVPGWKCSAVTGFPMPEISCPPRRSWSPGPWMPWAWMCSASCRVWPRWPNATGPGFLPPIPVAASKGWTTFAFEEHEPQEMHRCHCGTGHRPIQEPYRPRFEIPQIKKPGDSWLFP